MSVTFLQNNKVKYSSGVSGPVQWYANDKLCYNSNANFITANDYNYDYSYNAQRKYTLTINQQTGTSFTIASVNPSVAPVLVVYNARPSFTCSNFIDITSNDSITFTIKFNNTVMRTYTYPLQQQYMNFYNLTDYIWYGQKNSVQNITISATSTKVLTLVKPPKLIDTKENPYMNNCKVVVY